MGKILNVYPVNHDLLKERSKASFDPRELTYFLEGDKEKTIRRKELGKISTSLTVSLYDLSLFPFRYCFESYSNNNNDPPGDDPSLRVEIKFTRKSKWWEQLQPNLVAFIPTSLLSH